MVIKKNRGFGHEQPHEGRTNDWITPPWIITAFDSLSIPPFFDLDPCASVTQPWPCAARSFTVADDGLAQEWTGRIWLNPPYGPHAAQWVRKLAAHGNGIALLFARTETRLWQDDIFPTASAFLFLRRRVSFHRPDGTLPKSNSGAPSVLIAWGDHCEWALRSLADRQIIPGAFLWNYRLEEDDE